MVFIFTAATKALSTSADSVITSGAHGFSEILYAYGSSAGNNGSAFAGPNAETQWSDTMNGLAMLLGRPGSSFRCRLRP